METQTKTDGKTSQELTQWIDHWDSKMSEEAVELLFKHGTMQRGNLETPKEKYAMVIGFQTALAMMKDELKESAKEPQYCEYCGKELKADEQRFCSSYCHKMIVGSAEHDN